MCLTIPGRIVSVTDETPEVRTARVDFGGIIRTANLMFTPEVQVGDFVIVQAGFATRRLSEPEAREALEYHRQLEELESAPRAATTLGGVR
jgi:hydrogenase expression/formation protein HypC